MKTFVQLIKTEFKRIFQNDVVMAIFFGAPIVYGLLFGYVYKKAKLTNIPIIVVDEDGSPLSDKIIEALNDVETLQVVKVKTGTDGIQDMMKTNGYAAIIHIPEKFESGILQKRYPEIQVELNMSNILIANFASKNIQKTLETLKAGIEISALNKKGIPKKEALHQFESFKTNYHKLYNAQSNYQLFMLPGLLGAIMQQVIFLALALVFARDFEDGYFQQLLQKNKNPLYLIAVKITPFILLTTLVWIIVGSFYRMFDIDLHLFNGSMYLLIALLSISAMFIAMTFSVLIPSQLKATELLMVISTPAFILSGFTWPLSGMPQWIQSVSQWIPLTPFLSAFKKIAFYGGSLQHIKPEVRQLIYITLFSFLLLVVSLQIKIYWQSRKNKKKV